MSGIGFPGAPGRSPHGAELDPDLAVELAWVRAVVDQRRLAIFRSHTARRVRLASPLLLDACAEGELDAATWRLRPPSRWPRVAAASVHVRGLPNRWRDQRQPERSRSGHRAATRPVFDDVVVLRLSGRAANMVLRVGDASIRTSERGGCLMLPGMLSPDQQAGLLGGPLDRALDHPATRTGDYVIQSATVDAIRQRTVIGFSAAPAEWRVPWSRPGERHRR